jgi:hypothetical protein
MPNTMLRWIEQAEARQVTSEALFRQAPVPSWLSTSSEAVTQWFPSLCGWFCAGPGSPLPQSVPALARRPASCRSPRRDDDGVYNEWW